MSASTSAKPDRLTAGVDVDARQSPPGVDAFPALPTETEIYILPDGRVIVADLPLELASLSQALGSEPRKAPSRP